MPGRNETRATQTARGAGSGSQQRARQWRARQGRREGSACPWPGGCL